MLGTHRKYGRGNNYIARIPQSVQREGAVLLTMGFDAKYLVEKKSTQKQTRDETDQLAQNVWRTPGL